MPSITATVLRSGNELRQCARNRFRRGYLLKSDRASQPWKRVELKIASFLGHRAREFLIYGRRFIERPLDRPRVVIFPSETGTGSASDLRAFALAPALGQLGWYAICVPPQLELIQRQRVIEVVKPDVILLQQSRHPLNHPRYYPGTPCIFDADDADILDPRCHDRVVECCRGSTAIIAGNRYLAELYRSFNPHVSVVWTGSYLRPLTRRVPSSERAAVVTWAHSDPLGYPHEAEFVRKVVLGLARRLRFTFTLYGVRDALRPDVEEYLDPIRRSGIAVRVVRPMSYRRFVRSLNEAAVGLHPVCAEQSPFSRGKSFGKLLAYLAADVAIVTSDAVDHSLFFQDGINGALLKNDHEAWIERCHELLLHPQDRGRMVEIARSDFLKRLTTERAAQLVSEQLHRTIRLATAPGADRHAGPAEPTR